MELLKISLEDRADWLREDEIRKEMRENEGLLEQVKTGHPEYRESLGWLDVDEWAGEDWIARYEAMAEEIRKDCEALVVVGIGGSNQAARAVCEAIGERNGVKLVWAGNSISAHEINQALDAVRGRRFCVNVIAKNFETLEPGIGFRAMRALLREQYGEAYASRVVCTGTEGSPFEALAKKHGYRFLPFPKDIGGRFTALSPIGLFPLAAAGFDIRAMAEGAREMRAELVAAPAAENEALRVAVIRNRLYRRGFRMEMLSFFEPRFFRFAKWWMQLFGESEGKDGKGLYPLFGNFSEDLHSVGQFLQDGTHVIFETFLEVENSGASCVLHDDDVDDRFSYLDGKDFDDINRAACEATVTAHSAVFPCLRLRAGAIDEKTFGALFYWFEFLCYLSAKLLGVNPFDQPGVEAYKQHMFRILGK